MHNLQEYELDALIKFEWITDGEEKTRSWADIDESYGRVRAFQVEESWPLTRGRRRLESLSSISDLYLDTSYDTSGETVAAEQLIELQDCGLPNHLKNLDDTSKQQVLEGNL